MEPYRFINLTPHALTILCECDTGEPGHIILAKPAEGTEIPRVETKSEILPAVLGVPVFKTVQGGVTGLPAPRWGVYLIVSMAVRLAVPSRLDVFSPGELVRGSDGQPIGCHGLVSN